MTAPGAGYLTPGIKKFVDTLPGQGEANANDLGQYIPVAQPDTTTYPGTDYYEIAVVQYRMKFHRDLPATLLRGYVQLSTSVVPGKNLPLGNANLDPTKPDAPIAGLQGGRQAALPRPDDHGHEEPPGPGALPQPAAHRGRRRPVPARRHHRDGVRRRPER